VRRRRRSEAEAFRSGCRMPACRSRAASLPERRGPQAGCLLVGAAILTGAKRRRCGRTAGAQCPRGEAPWGAARAPAGAKRRLALGGGRGTKARAQRGQAGTVAWPPSAPGGVFPPCGFLSWWGARKRGVQGGETPAGRGGARQTMNAGAAQPAGRGPRSGARPACAAEATQTNRDAAAGVRAHDGRRGEHRNLFGGRGMVGAGQGMEGLRG